MSIECDGAHRCRCDRRSSNRHRGNDGHGDDGGALHRARTEKDVQKPSPAYSRRWLQVRTVLGWSLTWGSRVCCVWARVGLGSRWLTFDREELPNQG